MSEARPQPSATVSLRMYVLVVMAMRQDPETWDTDFLAGGSITARGYTMHEHLDDFGLINMPVRPKRSGGGNGRVDDPKLGRFLSPDPVIQAPGNPQNYNRYSYVLNNPLKYTDPSGEFIGTVFTAIVDFFKTGFVDGGFDLTSRKAMSNAWSDYDPTKPGTPTNNAFKIDAGFFLHIPGWETPQTFLGMMISHTRNITGNVDKVEIKNWTVHVANDNPRTTRRWGFTLGPYINTQNVETNDPMYRHELGHTIQSRFFGPLYLPVVGAPSIASAAFSSDRAHSKRWYEVQATRWGGAPHDPPNYSREYKGDSFGYWFGALSPYMFNGFLFL